MSSQKSNSKNRLILTIFFAFVVGMMLLTSYVYSRETSAFRFFDEENNIVAGYLITTGKHLYADIFMNHNPLPILMSAGIQQVFTITTLFELVKYHRYFMIVLALVANILLLIRFRQKAFVFIFVYEFLKFYLAGQMFLAEGMIAYIFAYFVLLLATTALVGNKIGTRDLIVSTLSFVFIALSREPYIPVAVLLFGLILYFAESRRRALTCVVGAGSAIVVFMMQFNVSEYFKQVVELNKALANGDLKAQSGMQMFSGLTQLYQYVLVGIRLDKPVYIILGFMSAIFLYIAYTIVRPLKIYSRIILVSIIIVTLFLAGIRNYEAGAEWYGMYRSIPYIVILLSFISSFASVQLVAAVMLCTVGVAMFHPRSHLREPRINAREYYVQYSNTNTAGQVINLLCSKYPKQCTLHIDDIDVYPYWITKLTPAYRYIFYYPVNKAYLDYKDIRQKELGKNPPTVYYDGSCMVDPTHLPQSLASKFVFLREFSSDTQKEKQSCIAVNKELLPYIDEDVRSSIAQHNLRLPSK